MKLLKLSLVVLLLSSCCTQHMALAQANISRANPTTIQDQFIKNEPHETQISIETNSSDNTDQYLDHSQWDKLLQKYVSKEGNVNYKGFKADWDLLKSYINFLGDNHPDDTWSRDMKLAYWINAYNALTIDLILKNYPVSSIKDIKDPWKQRLWKLGDTWYNLDEIEHDIIRKMNEPRIHFALVCAAVSCPKLYNKAFTANNLDDVLGQLTREFLADPSKNTITQDDLELSKIFQWFAKDFKQNGTLIDFLNQYTLVQIAPKAKKRFKDYNWELNE